MMRDSRNGPVARRAAPARRFASCIPFALAALPLGAHAAARVDSLAAYRASGWLHCDVVATGLLDARTASTVESGLPGSCVYRIEVQDERGTAIVRREVAMQLRLDLWSGSYLLDGFEGERAFSTRAAADSAWSHPTRVRLAPLEQLRRDRSYRLVARVVVSPLASRDRARLTRYVSQRSGEGSEEFSLDVGGLLDRFLRGGRESEASAPAIGPPFLWPELRESP